MKNAILLLALVTVFGCSKNADVTTSADIQETAQQVGDVMASVDESGGSSGTIAQMNNSVEKTFNRYAPGEVNSNLIAKLIQPEAQAAACSGTGFGTCSSAVITRDFAGCTVGTATFTGTVALTWTGASSNTCTMAVINDTITRVPNFTVTGRRGATLTVSKTGVIGQRITWASGTGATRVMSLSNDGINRKFTVNSADLFNQTTTTVSPITVTGTSRTNRVMNGGTLRVSNLMTGVNCDYAPSNVTWSAGCNCPTSGSWAGTCSDSKTSTLTLTSTCGVATYSVGSDTQSVTLDRCGT